MSNRDHRRRFVISMIGTQIIGMEDLEYYEAFLAQLTHEIQTPLVNTRNTASILRRELSSPKPNLKKMEDMLLDIEMHMNTSMRLVESIRYRRSDFTEQFSSKDVNASVLINMLKQVEHLSRRQVRRINGRTELRIYEDLERTKIHIDPTALELCLTNLAMNAATHALEGSTVFYEIVDSACALGIVIRNATTDANADTFEKWGEFGFSTSQSSTGLGLNIAMKICENQEIELSQKVQRDGSISWVTSRLSVPKCA